MLSTQWQAILETPFFDDANTQLIDVKIIQNTASSLRCHYIVYPFGLANDSVFVTFIRILLILYVCIFVFRHIFINQFMAIDWISFENRSHFLTFYYSERQSEWMRERERARERDRVCMCVSRLFDYNHLMRQ